jgi:hypothetical protein
MPQSDWRPIASAPRNGTLVLFYAPSYEDLPEMMGVCAYHPDGGWCVDELRNVTHWMPLPAPPEAADGQ